MRGKIMLEKIIFFVKLSLFPIWCWPLPKDATRLKITCVKMFHCLSIITAIGLLAPLIYAITNHLEDFLILVELILELSSVVHSIANFIVYIINKHRIQYITFTIIHFSELMKPHEDMIIQRYIDKCIIFHGITLFTYYSATIIFAIIIPIVNDLPFPSLAEYPFNVHYQPLHTIIYVQQWVVAIQIASQLCINILMALLLWFTSARFEILSEELRKTTDVYHLIECIKQHQYLLKYATETTITVRPFALISICCCTVCGIILCLLLLTNVSLKITYKYIGLALACYSEIFMYTWPAEHLIYTSQDVAQAAFDSVWYDQSVEISKCLQMIIKRGQKPITVAISSIMPTLCLNYFASYCSTIVSFFTTLRVFLSDEK